MSEKLLDEARAKVRERGLDVAYEKDVLIPSLDIMGVPSTLDAYRAYMVGFLHGEESQKEGNQKAIRFIVDTVIRNKEQKL